MATLSLTPAAMDPSSLAPPPQGGLLRSVGLALLAHALLIAALTWGVNWKSQDSPAVEAELWSSVRQQAAPRAAAPPPPPEPAPPPPQAKVEPPPAPPKAAPPPDTSVRDAQIALEREKKERERKEQRERELAERREQQRKEEQQRKAAAEKKKQEELAQAKREAQEKALKAEKAEADRKAADARRKAQAAAKEAQEEAEREADRQANIRRMQGMAGATGAPSATGAAQQSTGPSASYGAKVTARVRPNIVFPDNVPGNPSADVEVRSAPDGTILSRRLVKSSGNKAWDEAVLRAIDKTETMPRDTDGRVPSPLTIGFRPRE